MAPANGYAINVQLRPGSFTAALPITPAMTFVEETYQVIALYQQNELHQVEPGNEAEFTLDTYPAASSRPRSTRSSGRKGRARSRQRAAAETGYGPMPPGRFPVKLTVAEKRARSCSCRPARSGHGAIYTEHGELIHIIRKVILRVGAKLDYLVLKMH